MPPLLANAGTLLIWGSMFHILFGNIVIGVIEAAIMKRFLRPAPLQLTLWCTFANYLSAFFGGIAVMAILDALPLTQRLAVDHPTLFLWLSIAAAFVVSVLIEWPILRWRARTPILFPLLLANIVSYLLLLPFFLWLPANNLADWSRPALGTHPNIPGYRLVFITPAGTDQSFDLGEFSPSQPFTTFQGPGIGQAAGREDTDTWFIGSHGYGRTYFRNFDRENVDTVLIAESPYHQVWPRSMVTINDHYLACQLGPYITLIDPETHQIYRLAEGSNLRVLKTKPAKPSTRGLFFLGQ